LKKFSLFLVIAALAAIAAVALAACGGGGSSSSSSESTSSSGSTEGKEGGTLKGAYSESPDYMDPQLSYTAQGWTAMRPVYIPMLYYKSGEGQEGSEIVPGLAKEMPKVTNGGKTYTMFMRPGLKYSNGEEIKAGDFKYAVERAFVTNSGGSPFYSSIVGAEQFAKTKKGGISGIKVNEKTGEIVINLEGPRGTFENELALMFVAPVPQGTPMEDESASPPPASGPYYITESQPNRGWTYERNPYWEKDNAKQLTEIPSGKVDKIEMEVLPNQATQVNEIESGELNWLFDPVPADRLQQVKEKFEGSQLRLEPTISTLYFWMNMTEEPFNNKKVREAVNYAVDPAALERIYTGLIKGSQQILPPGMPGYKKFELYPHNMQKAKELMAESGVKDKEITVWTDTRNPNPEVGAYYEGVLKELGFKTELKVVNANNYFTVLGNLSTPNLDTGWSDWFEDYPHPNDFFDILLNGESIQQTNNENFSQSNIPALNKKIDKLASEQLGPQQEKEYAELDEEFMKEAAWAPYGTETETLFVSEDINLENIIWNPTFETELSSIEFK
jgi:peptide/nickel transport system substrate-binding protein